MMRVLKPLQDKATIWIADAHRGDGQRSLCTLMKSWPRFWSLKRRFKRSSGLRLRYNRRAVESSGKFVLNYVIRQFQLIFGRAEKPEGADLRWNCRLTRSLGPTGARVIRSEIAFWNKFRSEGDFRFRAELDLQLIQKRKDSTYGEHSPESLYFAK